MSNNLFVSFDVHDASREAPLILSAIEELGQTVRIFSNVWYVRTELPAAEAARRVWDVMQPLDQLLVIDASSDEAATFNLPDRCLQRMLARWHLEVDVLDVRQSSRTPVALLRLDPGSREHDRASGT